MINLFQLDLLDPAARLPAVAGEAWVLVHAGRDVLGEIRLRSYDPLDEQRVRVEAAERFGTAILARRSLTAVRRAGGLPASAVSIVVCTRDRPALLRGCLAALCRLQPAPGEILVVDNAPTDDGTARLVAQTPGVRRVVEPEPGLDRARNRGWHEAHGEAVAYVDDDARVDINFAGAVGAAFAAPEVGAVTGLVLAAELDTYAQICFERDTGGMRKGFQRQLHHRDDTRIGLEAFRLGVGTNMAFRRELLRRLGGFDPRLDVGTRTRGGGDLDMLWRALESGAVVAYEPSAVVRHIHRRDRKSLVAQFRDNGIAYSAFLALRAEASPAAARTVARYRRRWHVRRHLLDALRAVRGGQLLHLQLAIAELKGSRRGREALAAETAASLAQGEILPGTVGSTAAPPSRCPPREAAL